MRINLWIKEIPLPIRLFLGKALLLFILWQVLYNFFLYDASFADRLLTSHIGQSSVKILNNIGSINGFTSQNELYTEFYRGENLEVQETAIYHNKEIVLSIAHACNGLSLMALFIGFIICMPSPFWRKIKYIIIGIILLDIINILRCIGLIYLQVYLDAYFEFAHHYLFKATVYTSTFIMWIIFSRKINLKNDTL